MFSRKTMWALVALMLCATTAGGGRAGSARTVTGTVTDSTGGVLPGVTVVVKNTETGVQQDVVTDGNGRYQVIYLNPGTYVVTAELSGFKKFVSANTRVGISDVIRVDAMLSAGAVQETVQVTAESPSSTPARSAALRWTPSRSRNCRSATARPTC